MRRLAIMALLVLALAGTAHGLETEQEAVQPLWWTQTLCDTIEANDWNRWVVDWNEEVALFTSDQPGSLRWWNGETGHYAAPTTYWYFDGGEVVDITSKGGIDSLYVFNTGGTDATCRLIGQRR